MDEESDTRENVPTINGVQLIRVMVTGEPVVMRNGTAALLEEEDDIEVFIEEDYAAEMPPSALPDGTDVAVVMAGMRPDLDIFREISSPPRPAEIVLVDCFSAVQVFDICRAVGVRGFVERDPPGDQSDAFETLVEAVRTVASGRDFEDPAVSRTPPNPYGLTARQLKVLAAFRFRCNIADVLSISQEAVKQDLTAIKERMGLGSRNQTRTMLRELI